jgi:transcriptional regulator with XRE-family HTH domain
MNTNGIDTGTPHRRRRAVVSKHVRARRADERDGEVGRRVRSRRLERQLSQTDLGGRIGVTFQQVQKYEKGVNRIGAGRLARIAEALEVPVTFFFGNDTLGSQPNEMRQSNQVSNVFALAQDGRSVRLMTAFSRINSRKRRLLIVEMAEAMADE